MSRKDNLLELLSGIIKAVPEVSKFFHRDGRAATKVETNREDLIHIDEVKGAMDSLIERNKLAVIQKETEEDSVKNTGDDYVALSIERINNPNVLTESKDADQYGLNPEQRRWLLEYIFCVEGGYFNHPNDPGGETMYGIIKTEARANGYTGPMKDLPKEVATEIYLRKYWKNHRLSDIKDFKKALCIFDFLVNSGARGTKVAQKAVNKILDAKGVLQTTKKQYKNLSPLVVDGKMGPMTIDAINKIDTEQFLYVYFIMQEDTYEDLMRANPKLRSFDEGWENRMVKKALFLSQIKK